LVKIAILQHAVGISPDLQLWQRSND